MRTNPGPPRTSRGQEKDYKGPHRQKVQFYRKLSNQYTIHVYQKLNIENITPQKHFEPGSLNFPSNQHYFWRRWHHPQRPSIRDLCSTTLWIIQYLQLLKNYIIESLLIPAHKIFWACKWLLGALIAGSTPIELGMYCFFCVVREYRLFNKKPVNQLFSDMYYQVLHLTHKILLYHCGQRKWFLPLSVIYWLTLSPPTSNSSCTEIGCKTKNQYKNKMRKMQMQNGATNKINFINDVNGISFFKHIVFSTFE